MGISELLGAIIAEEEFASLAGRGRSEIKDDPRALALETKHKTAFH